MLIFHDPQCAEYGSAMRPEQPARTLRTAEHLRTAHPDWVWQVAPAAIEADLLLAHTSAHLQRFHRERDFDPDTPWFEGIFDHARRGVGSALAAMNAALAGKKAFSLMRPPGHHATSGQAMGFCYLNQIALSALAAQAMGVKRIAIWDFDAHHGNGTEAIIHGARASCLPPCINIRCIPAPARRVLKTAAIGRSPPMLHGKCIWLL